MTPNSLAGLLVRRTFGVVLDPSEALLPGAVESVVDVAINRGTHKLTVPGAQAQQVLATGALAVFDLLTCELPSDQKALRMVVEARVCPKLDPYDHLPREHCPIDGLMQVTLDLVDVISTNPIWRFARDVLARRDVYWGFWQMRASARHHHDYAGGLALHSLQVARDLAAQGGLDDSERDLLIAGGLLHDIGKVWSYQPNMFLTAEARALGHEQVGLVRLSSELANLEVEYPNGAYAMRVLLGGARGYRPDGTRPSSLLARLKACDQYSCERDFGNATRKDRSWIPKPWNPVD